MKILAIDYGTKRIGLAVNRLSLAEPLMILPQSDQIFNQLLEILAQEKIELILVGISEQAMAQKTREFVQALAQKTAIPIEYTDETLSSREAQVKLKQARPNLVRRVEVDDLAASIFLQEYLDTHD